VFTILRFSAVLLAPAVILTACTSGGKPGPSSTTPSGASTASGKTAASTTGVAVSGGFGTAPTLTIPTTPAPGALTQQVLTPGSGAPVAKGDTLVANYLGETWAPKNGKAAPFDSSFSRGTPAAFVIGTGRVIPGWDKTLVDKTLGTRATSHRAAC
jgi:peptidylprolyl isomerase